MVAHFFEALCLAIFLFSIPSDGRELGRSRKIILGDIRFFFASLSEPSDIPSIRLRRILSKRKPQIRPFVSPVLPPKIQQVMDEEQVPDPQRLFRSRADCFAPSVTPSPLTADIHRILKS